MTSNLNKAFMRAYAKERQPAPGSEAPIASEPALTSKDATLSSGTQPVQVKAPHYSPVHATSVQARPKLVAEPMATLQSARATTRPQAQPAIHVQPEPRSDSTTAGPHAAAVWQRIDEAQAFQPPHVTNPPSRPVMSAVSVGSAAGPQRTSAAATSPRAPVTAYVANPALAEQLPLIHEEAGTRSPQNSETRRRTVADFLYSAGQYPAGQYSAGQYPAGQYPAGQYSAGQNSAGQNSAQQNSVTQNRAGQASMAAGAVSATQLAPRALSASHPAVETMPPIANMSTPRSMPAANAKPTAMASSSVAAMSATPMSQSTVATSTMNAPVVAPKRQPVAEPRSPDFASGRMGQILRVDVPRGAQKSSVTESAKAVSASEARSSVAVVHPAETMESATAKFVEPAARYVIEQRRIDRAHELDATEEKLRRYKHKIFNPVWEVDCLQWPSVVDKLMQHRAESMSQVAAHLKAACEDGLSVLGVSSSDEGEGRTTVACCLARLAAAHGLNVVVVDLDLDRPTLCIQTNMEIEHDWRDCFAGEVTLEEVAVHSIDDQLTLLPLKPRGNRPGLLASDSRIADMLNQLSESFELVVVDCSRMNSSGNVISGLAHAEIFDAAILVVDRRDSHQERVEDAVRVIQQTGIESIGIVDNFSM